MILLDIRMRTAISSSSRGKGGARITRNSGTRSDDLCYRQGYGSRNSSTDSKSTKDETFVADINNVTGCDKCHWNGKAESKTTEDDKPNSAPPGIGFSVAMCHPPLSQEADDFQRFVDSGSSSISLIQS